MTQKQNPFFFVTFLLHSTKTSRISLEASQCICVRCIWSGSSQQPLQSFLYSPKEHATAVGGCHRAWLSHFHTLFTTHYYLSITCNYPSWWLMECFRGSVGKQLGLSCWGLYIISQSLNTAQCEVNLRGASYKWLGCCVRTSRLLGQPLVTLCCIQESDLGTDVVWAMAVVHSHQDQTDWMLFFGVKKSVTLVFHSQDNALQGLFYKLSWWWWGGEDVSSNCLDCFGSGLWFHLNEAGWW